MTENKILIEKLKQISNAWKAQYPLPPELPLVWKVEDGMLFLDDVWIAPIKYLIHDKLGKAVAWVNPLAIELELIGGTVDIIITKWMGQYAITGVERTVV